MCQTKISKSEYKYYQKYKQKAKFKSPEEELEYAKTILHKCNRCFKLLSLDNFMGNTSGDLPFDKNGYRYRRKECIGCLNEYRQGKNKALAFAKANGLPTKAPEGAVCAICSSTNKLCFDHEHGGDFNFRGWLCRSCNIGIGLVSSHSKTTDFESIVKTLAYLFNAQKSDDIKAKYLEILTNMVNSFKQEIIVT